MARRKYKKKRRQKDLFDFHNFTHIDAETKKSIIAILIFALGFISVLSLFNLAGQLGIYLNKAWLYLFGWGRWLAPFYFLAISLLLYNREKYQIKTSNYIGVAIFIISFQTSCHFFIQNNQWKYIIASGDGGGYLGYFLALGFHYVLDFWGSVVLLFCLFFISSILIFDTSLKKIIGSESIFAFLFKKIKNSKSEEKFYTEEKQAPQVTKESIQAPEEPRAHLGLADSFRKGKLLNWQSKKIDPQIKEMPESKPSNIPTPQPIPKISPQKKTQSTTPKANIQIDLPLNLLSGEQSNAAGGNIEAKALKIQETLENFGISVEMGAASVGPTVTQYTFKPAQGIKLSKITTLNNDLALALAAHPIRIEAPIPGKSLVGIEVPNESKAIVRLREILDSKNFHTRKNNMMIAIGKDVSGTSTLYDLTRMPHLLVAGATNSGKSVCLNAIIVSLLYQNNPQDLRFIMVDPKRVELPVYNGIPHLLTKVITDVPKTINALRWCLNEMDRRFEILSKYKKRNIASYNESINAKNEDGKMPYLVFIIDELADLMVVAARDIEASIIRLAQMARAVGIHLILATQRPSVDVITGLIKANTPARIAFSVSSGVDSKTILDSLGAEKLLGQGDMLFSTPETSQPIRLQGAFLSDDEIKAIINYIKIHSGEVEYIDAITERQKVGGLAGHGMDISDSNDDVNDNDELFEEAKEIIINMGKASASLLQRKLSIGYARAARLLDLLEDAGIVGAANGSKPREILVSQEQYAESLAQPISGTSLHNKETSQAPNSYLDTEDTSTVLNPIQNESDKNEEIVQQETEEEIDKIPEEPLEKKSDSSFPPQGNIYEEEEGDNQDKKENIQEVKQDNSNENDHGKYFAK